MKYEGMVHALQELRRLLTPTGYLIDLHPAKAPTLIEVHHRGEVLLSVPIPNQSFEDIEHADNAISLVVADGLFTVEQAMTFELRTYALSRAELRDYIAQESAYDEFPSTEMLALEDPVIAARIEALMQDHPREAQVARLNPARISTLRPTTGGLFPAA
jgi:hypothetical protein